MKLSTFDQRCAQHYWNYLKMLMDGQWTLEHAHAVLVNASGADNLDLFQHAALARAIGTFQLEEPTCPSP